MTKNELAINNWVRHRDQGDKPYRITSITIDGDKYLYTAEGLEAGDTYVDIRAAAFEPIAITEEILKMCGYIQMVDPNNPERVLSEKFFSIDPGGAIIESSIRGYFNISMAGTGGQSSFLTKRVKHLHELQNLCKAFDGTIVNVDWTLMENKEPEIDSNVDEGEPMW